MDKIYINQMSPEEIRKNIKPYKKIWKNNFTTNCYAFALGLDIPETRICYHAYQPGVISSTHHQAIENRFFSYDNLIEGINNDLDFLNIEAREILPDEKIAEDEFMNCFYNEDFDNYSLYAYWYYL